MPSLVGSEMCIRDRFVTLSQGKKTKPRPRMSAWGDAIIIYWGIPEIDSNRSRAPRDQCIFELLPEIGASTDFDSEINAN